MTALHDEDQQKGKRRPGRGNLGVGVFLLCLSYALNAGLLKRDDVRSLDAQWLYVGGSCWASGESPYDQRVFFDRWRTVLDSEPLGPFPSPPWIAVVAVPMSLLPWDRAKVAFDTINFSALCMCLYWLARILGRVGRVDWRRRWPWIALGSGCLISGVPATLFLGQSTILALAGSLGAIHCWQRGRMWASAALILLAAAKPQIAALPLLYMLIAGGHWPILMGTLVTAIAGAWALSMGPMAGLVDDMVASIRGYQALDANRPPHITGLSTLGWGIAFKQMSLAWMAAGAMLVAGVGLIGRRRARPSVDTNSTETVDMPERASRMLAASQLRLPFAATGALVQLHGYDFALYLPIIISLFMFEKSRKVMWFLPGLVVVARPHNVQMMVDRLVGDGGAGWVGHIPTMGAAYVLICCIADVLREHAARIPSKAMARGILGSAHPQGESP